MSEPGNIRGVRIRSWLQFGSVILIVVLAEIIGSLIRLRIDLTSDKRYTLSEPSRKVLGGIRNDIFVQVYLDGDMPIPFKRLKRSVKELLDEFRIASGRKIDYDFINPSAEDNPERREAMYQSLVDKGLYPINIQSGDREGGASQKIVFPGLIVNYNGIEIPVNFLENNQSISAEENLLHSEEGLEYEMIQTISTVSSDTVYKIAFLEGQGEIPEAGVGDITFNLARFFTIDRGTINSKPGVLDGYAAVVIAGPEKEFSENDKFILDQYVMNGGKVLWLVDEVNVNTDSLVSSGETAAIYRPLNIEDQLFRYGARINPVIVQDLDCATIRLAVLRGGVSPQFIPAPWPYYPKLEPDQGHPLTRNLNRVRGEYVSYIDTVGLDPKIRKSILLTTSAFSRILSPPFLITLKEAELLPEEKEFNKGRLPVAVLLEGKFPSLFRNRIIKGLTDSGYPFRSESVSTKMIVIADGDVIRNEIRRSGGNEIPQTLGQDQYTSEMYGNRDFIINCLNYLVDDHGIMELRSRELKLRLLDREKIRKERLMWQMINLAGPVFIVVVAGIIYGFFRRRRYTRAQDE